jgi:hypothetical protein
MVRSLRHALQNGIRVPVSNILPQIRQGAGNNTEAKAARMARN